METICMEFANTFQDKLTWEWDDRFEAVLARRQDSAQGEIQALV